MLTRRTADLAVALGCAWLGVTLYVNLMIGPMTLGFYLGHVLEIAAVILVAVPAALDIKRAGASRPLVGDLSATDLVASEQAYLGPRVRALMVRLEGRDVSTEEHTRRVALLAAQVGEELKLSAASRRHLAVGGLLHDIGKLSVPLEILQKPGPLTDAEFAAIKRHPADGRRLLEELGGFPEAVRGLVSDHHERLDGGGYPRGLTADQMSIETRILAVVDVYDALVSDRVYRAAWTPERAFGLLEEESRRVRPDRGRRAQALCRRRAAPAWIASASPRPRAQAPCPLPRAPRSTYPRCSTSCLAEAPARWDRPARESLALLRRTTATEARRSAAALAACEAHARRVPAARRNRGYRRCATAPLARTDAFAIANSRMLAGLASAAGPTRACRSRLQVLSGTANSLAFVSNSTLRGGLDAPWNELLEASHGIRALAEEALRLARGSGSGTGRAERGRRQSLRPRPCSRG